MSDINEQKVFGQDDVLKVIQPLPIKNGLVQVSAALSPGAAAALSGNLFRIVGNGIPSSAALSTTSLLAFVSDPACQYVVSISNTVIRPYLDNGSGGAKYIDGDISIGWFIDPAASAGGAVDFINVYSNSVQAINGLLANSGMNIGVGNRMVDIVGGAYYIAGDITPGKSTAMVINEFGSVAPVFVQPGQNLALIETTLPVLDVADSLYYDIQIDFSLIQIG